MPGKPLEALRGYSRGRGTPGLGLLDGLAVALTYPYSRDVSAKAVSLDVEV